MKLEYNSHPPTSQQDQLRKTQKNNQNCRNFPETYLHGHNPLNNHPRQIAHRSRLGKERHKRQINIELVIEPCPHRSRQHAVHAEPRQRLVHIQLLHGREKEVGELAHYDGEYGVEDGGVAVFFFFLLVEEKEGVADFGGEAGAEGVGGGGAAGGGAPTERLVKE